MALELSTTAQAYLNQQAIEPNLVLEIDGMPYIFGSNITYEILKIGSFVIGDGSKIGGVQERSDAKDWIMLNGTTNNIGQQINIDRAEGSSISSFKISLIDKAGTLTNLFAPSVTVDDILGTEAKIYWQPKGTAFPRDAATIFIGVIDRVQFKQGSVIINVAHPDQLKRQDILAKATCKLTSDFSIGDTIAFVDDPTGFLEDQDLLTCYFRINDEIVKYQAISGGNFVSCTRAQLGTIEADHATGDDLEVFYRIQGKPFDIALKVLLSDPDNTYFGNQSVKRFVDVDSGISLSNAVYFEESNIQDKWGLVAGDLIYTQLATNGGNNFNATITGFGQTSSGSYILVNRDDLVPETDSGATCYFRTQYNTLNFGCAIKPYQVDVAQFERLNTLVGSRHPDLDIYIKDTVQAGEFLEKEIFFPAGIYSVPRKGRISCNITAPPLATADTVTLNEENITNAADLSVDRTTNERFYNAIVYKFDVDSIDDKFLAARITQSTDSTNRIRIGNKYLTIESNGLRNNATTRNLIDIQSRRFIDRYQFGAEKINIECYFSDGFGVEIGDTVVLDAANLRLSDSKTGTKDFAPRVMEITNRTVNLKTGKISLECTDTGYSNNARYGVIAPSSIVKTGSTTTTIKIQNSYSTADYELEISKWRSYIGEKINIRSSDWSTVYTTFLVGITESKVDELVVYPAITAPIAGMIVDVPQYDTTNYRNMKLWKAVHCFLNPQDSVVSATGLTFTVADGSLYFTGASVRIHSDDYVDDHETTVVNVASNTVTFKDACPFTIDNTHLIDNIGFADRGAYYALF